jgi:hypothetical protein
MTTVIRKTILPILVFKKSVRMCERLQLPFSPTTCREKRTLFQSAPLPDFFSAPPFFHSLNDAQLFLSSSTLSFRAFSSLISPFLTCLLQHSSSSSLASSTYQSFFTRVFVESITKCPYQGSPALAVPHSLSLKDPPGYHSGCHTPYSHAYPAFQLQSSIPHPPRPSSSI